MGNREVFDKDFKVFMGECCEVIRNYEGDYEEEFNNLERFAQEIKTKLEQRIMAIKDSAKPKKGRPKKNVDSLCRVTEENKTLRESDLRVSNTGKPRRMASQIASMLINKQQHLPAKLRRPSESNDLIDHQKNLISQVMVKAEKNVTDSTLEPNESLELMPPPKPLKTRRLRQRKIKQELESSDTENESSARSTRSKTRTKVTQKDPVKTPKKPNSDIIILPDVPVLRITISDDENVNNQEVVDQGTESELVAQQTVTVLLERLPLSEINEPEKISRMNRKEDESTDSKSSPDVNEKENSKSDEKRKKKQCVWSSGDEENRQANKRTKKIARTKKTNKKEPVVVVEKIPLIALENLKVEKDVSLYEDALTNSPVSGPTNQTFAVHNIMSPHLNATVTITKPNCNATFNKGSVEDASSATNAEVNIEDLRKKHGIVNDCSVVLKKNDEAREEVEESSVSVEKLPAVDPVSPTWEKPIAPADLNESLLTEDDSYISPEKPKKRTPQPKKTPKKSSSSQSSENTPKNQKNKRGVKTKPMFSPYAESPVKKRVAAFEKLQQKSEIPMYRVTRTKTKKLIEERENRECSAQRPVKQPTKYQTPLKNNKIKITSHTDGKIRIGTVPMRSATQNSSALSTSTDSSQRSQSAMKPSQKEQMEEQRRRLEKEKEAKRKKEALLQAKIDEQKRIREEKMLRAKETREEKERLKEEKLRQALNEKNEKLREEQEKKRAYLAQKAADMEEQRRNAERNRLARQREELLRQKEEEEQRRLALKKQQMMAKMKQKPPPLPTLDTSDSDSEGERKKVPVPTWAQRHNLHQALIASSHVPETVLTSMYNKRPTTPDLVQIFKNIPLAYTKRNSSAVWRTPPRHSQMPKY